MRIIKRLWKILFCCGLIWGLGLGTAWAGDFRPLRLSSLYLATGEAPLWIEPSESRDFFQPQFKLSDQIKDPISLEATNQREYQAYVNVDRRFGRVFNLSLAAAKIKEAGSTGGFGPGPGPSGGGDLRPARALAPTERSGSVQDSDLWAVALGLDMLVLGNQGFRLGYLYGTDPLSGWSGNLEPDGDERQSLDVGYVYDLDGLYLSMGYVYSFGPLFEEETSGRGAADSSVDSTVYLRFQLRF